MNGREELEEMNSLIDDLRASRERWVCLAMRMHEDRNTVGLQKTLSMIMSISEFIGKISQRELLQRN
jgi:hypothetical protein